MTIVKECCGAAGIKAGLKCKEGETLLPLLGAPLTFQRCEGDETAGLEICARRSYIRAFHRTPPTTTTLHHTHTHTPHMAPHPWPLRSALAVFIRYCRRDCTIWRAPANRRGGYRFGSLGQRRPRDL